MAGEVSLLCLFPFLRNTTLKKVPDRAAFASLLFTRAKSRLASSPELLPVYFRLLQRCCSAGRVLLWSSCIK